MNRIFKKKILLPLCMLLFIGSTAEQSQAQDIFIGKEHRFYSKSGSFDIIGKVKDLTYVYRATDSDYFLDAYNDSMRIIATIALDFFPKKVDKTIFINYEDKIIVLFRSEEKGSIILSGAILNEKGLLQGRVKKLDEEKISWMRSKENYYEVAYSEDRSKLVVVNRGGSNKGSEFKLLTFDDALTLLTNKKIKVQKDEIGNKVNLNYLQVANNGTVIIPAFSVTSRGSIENASVLIFNDVQSDYTNIAISKDKEYFSDMIVKVDNHFNKLNIASLYKDGNGGNVKGIQKSVIEMSVHSLIQSEKLEFPEKFLKTYKEKNWKRSFNYAKVQQFIVKADGGFLIVTEDQQFSVRNAYNGGYLGYSTYYGGPASTSNIREYTFGDIVIMNYSPDGVLIWSEYVRKKQFSQEDEGAFSSYSFLNTGGNLVFLFNNFETRDNSIGIAAVDNSGKLQLSKLNQFVINNEWYMKGAKQLSNRSILIPVFTKSNINFAKIDF